MHSIIWFKIIILLLIITKLTKLLRIRHSVHVQMTVKFFKNSVQNSIADDFSFCQALHRIFYVLLYTILVYHHNSYHMHNLRIFPHLFFTVYRLDSKTLPPVDLYLISEKSIWKNKVGRTGFLVYFELDFYCLCSLKKSILKLIFTG